MSNLLQGFTGGNTVSVTNPFQPFPIPTASGVFSSDLSSIGLDPTQQALVDFFGGEQDVRTRDIYDRLGLSGSTGMAEDLGFNELGRLAESANIISGNRSQAIQEQGTLGNLAQQEASLAANTALSTQRNQIAANQQGFNQANTALSNLSNLVSGFT